MATLPASQHFDLNQPFRDLQRGRPLYETRCAKHGSALDVINARMFAAQLSAAGGGVRVESSVQRERTVIRCAIDPVHERVAVRRNEGGCAWYTLYDLSQASTHEVGTMLARFPQPLLSDAPVIFQGYAIFGQHLYALYRTDRPSGEDVDSYIARIDMNSGRVQSRSQVRVAPSLIFREPEGMAIYRTRDGRLRLFIGFGSRASLNGPKRYTGLYYNDALRAA